MLFTDYLAAASRAALHEVGAAASATEVLSVDESWMQGRSTFGGLTAAIALQAMQAHAGGRVLRNFNCNFVGPVDDAPLSLAPVALRSGKSVTVLGCRIMQPDGIKLDATAAFGDSRDSDICVDPAGVADVGLVEDGAPLPHVAGVTPNFTEYFDYAFTDNKLPFTGRGDGVMNGYMRFRESAVKADAALTPMLLLGLIDAWPPATLPLLRKVVPASTLAWNVQFVQPCGQSRATDWFRYEAKIAQAADGYGFTHARVWNERDELLAFSQQTVTVFG
ncbi:MAG: acyl-CoA thioesterase II [unclassified Hahellaceae]|nr:acyl-CoA thioesterase II [Hahellaceae bacterium]|tara:strand:- start:18566 stop:19396 length:831 start_codon:yes stop_codon:yes gene_type:complete